MFDLKLAVPFISKPLTVSYLRSRALIIPISPHSAAQHSSVLYPLVDGIFITNQTTNLSPIPISSRCLSCPVVLASRFIGYSCSYSYCCYSSSYSYYSTPTLLLLCCTLLLLLLLLLLHSIFWLACSRGRENSFRCCCCCCCCCCRRRSCRIGRTWSLFCQSQSCPHPHRLC